MKDLTFKKQDLIDRIQVNRDAHGKTFRDGIEGYGKEMLRRAKDITRELNNGNLNVSGMFMDAYSQPRPVDHTGEYDALLDMLRLTEDELIALPYAEFVRYVRDEWPWKQEFVGTVSNYTQR